MNSDLKIGRPVQLLVLGVVCLFAYALVADTFQQTTKGAREIERTVSPIKAELCAALKAQGVKGDGC